MDSGKSSIYEASCLKRRFGEYIWYSEAPFQTYNEVDRSFYESINDL